jgi:hypothetical protein
MNTDLHGYPDRLFLLICVHPLNLWPLLSYDDPISFRYLSARSGFFHFS